LTATRAAGRDRRNCVETVALLLDKGADVDANSDG
jgi:hypothetical protein